MLSPVQIERQRLYSPQTKWAKIMFLHVSEGVHRGLGVYPSMLGAKAKGGDMYPKMQ